MILGLMIFCRALGDVSSCWWPTLPRDAEFLGTTTRLPGLLFLWLKRYGFGNGFFPTNAVERMLWAVWLGYLLAFSSIFWVMRAEGKGHLDMYAAGVGPERAGLVRDGRLHLGRGYMIGLLYLIAAPLMTQLDGSPWAPAVFGLSWGLTFLAVGLRYRRLGIVHHKGTKGTKGRQLDRMNRMGFILSILLILSNSCLPFVPFVPLW